MENVSFYNAITIIIFLYVGFMVEQGLFYFTNTKYCERNKGNCKNCTCWSCPRFQFLTKDGELREFKAENKINFCIIKNKFLKIFKIKNK